MHGLSGILDDKGTALEKQQFTWKGMSGRRISKLDDDAFTRGRVILMSSRSIRVNGVAPGPIWTPLIPSTFSAEQVPEFGGNTPMQRSGQPAERVPACVCPARQDSGYVSGQVLQANGGTVVNG